MALRSSRQVTPTLGCWRCRTLPCRWLRARSIRLSSARMRELGLLIAMALHQRTARLPPARALVRCPQQPEAAPTALLMTRAWLSSSPLSLGESMGRPTVAGRRPKRIWSPRLCFEVWWGHLARSPRAEQRIRAPHPPTPAQDSSPGLRRPLRRETGRGHQCSARRRPPRRASPGTSTQAGQPRRAHTAPGPETSPQPA
jgi:hypothetical protein